ncbi:MAG: glycosyltransferase family 2 protein [Deltaproteobacteria bacterium]|nr:glycosyltransferase family 2 protein [Deltaproteobacteria bacterium]
MTRDPVVFVILPVHNRWEQTRKCLACLAGQTHGNLRVVLVDDGSTDGTRQHVEQEFPGVTVLGGDGTLWWAGGVNRGIDFAMREASSEDFLLILNNDLAFEKTFILDLCRESVERGRAALFPASVDNRTGELADTGLLVDWEGTRIVPAHKGAGGAAPAEPDAFSTRGLLLPVPVVSTAGRLRERELPHYLSDIEYTIRIQKMGLPIFRSKRVTTVLDTSTSGLHTAPGTGSPWRDIRNHLFDYRSSSNIVHWIRFLRICCPRKYMPRWIYSILVSEAKFAVKTLLAGARGRA